MGLFERRDDENKLTAEKKWLIFHIKIGVFVRFCIPVLYTDNNNHICKQMWGAKSNQIINFLYEKLVLSHFSAGSLFLSSPLPKKPIKSHFFKMLPYLGPHSLILLFCNIN